MSESSASPSSAAPAAALSCLDRHHFLLRRLHSLSGIVPVGLFVIAHLFTNFQMLLASLTGNLRFFQEEVEFIHSLPALLFIELALWLSIAFHAGLGLVYTFTGKSNTKAYPYGDNLRYTLQRITGIVALIFIFVHIAKLRWGWSFFGVLDTPFYAKGPNGEPLAQASTAIALQHSWWVLLGYILGVYAVVYHWCNGLWTAAISWGLTISVQAQRRWGYACGALGVALAVFSAGAIAGALLYQVSPQEKAMIAQMEGRPGMFGELPITESGDPPPRGVMVPSVAGDAAAVDPSRAAPAAVHP